MVSLNQKTINSVKLNGIRKFGTSLMSFIKVTILARILGPEVYGLMTMVLMVIGFAMLFERLGLSDAIIQKKSSSDEELSTIYWLRILLGILTYIIVYLLTPFISNIFSEPALINLIPVVGITIIITPFGANFYALAKKNLDFKFISIVDVFASFIMAVSAIVGAWVFELGVWAVVYAELLRVIIRTIFLIYYGYLKGLLPVLHFKLRDIRSYIRFGLFQTGSSIINYFYSYGVQIILGATLGAEALGYFDLAKQIITKPIKQISPIITDVAFPVFSNNKENKDKIKEGYLQIIEFILSITSPMIFGVAATAVTFVPIILGNEWISIVPIMIALSIYSMLISLGGSGAIIQKAYARTDWSFYWNIFRTGFTLSFIYIISTFGEVFHLALFLSVAQIVYFVLGYYLMNRKLIGKFFDEIIAHIWFPIAISIIMGIVVYQIPMLLNINKFIVLGIQILTGVIIYGISNWLYRKDYIIDILNMIVPKKYLSKLS